MLFNWASLIVQDLRNSTSTFLYDGRVQLYHPTLLLVFSLAITWLGWRCWRFTITPLLHPNGIKELPYWIPCKSLRESLSSFAFCLHRCQASHLFVLFSPPPPKTSTKSTILQFSVRNELSRIYLARTHKADTSDCRPRRFVFQGLSWNNQLWPVYTNFHFIRPFFIHSLIHLFKPKRAEGFRIKNT